MTYYNRSVDNKICRRLESIDIILNDAIKNPNIVQLWEVTIMSQYKRLPIQKHQKIYLTLIIILVIILFCPRPYTRVPIEKIEKIEAFDAVTGKLATITDEEQIRYFADNWRHSWYIPNYIQYILPGDGGAYYQICIYDDNEKMIESLIIAPKGDFRKPLFIIDKRCRDEISKLNYER